MRGVCVCVCASPTRRGMLLGGISNSVHRIYCSFFSHSKQNVYKSVFSLSFSVMFVWKLHFKLSERQCWGYFFLLVNSVILHLTYNGLTMWEVQFLLKGLFIYHTSDWRGTLWVKQVQLCVAGCLCHFTDANYTKTRFVVPVLPAQWNWLKVLKLICISLTPKHHSLNYPRNWLTNCDSCTPVFVSLLFPPVKKKSTDAR